MYFINDKECAEAVSDVLDEHMDALREIASAVRRLCNDDTDTSYIVEGIIENLQEVVWYNSDEEPDPEVAEMRARAEYENVGVDMYKERDWEW